jgi:hypothetical protein
MGLEQRIEAVEKDLANLVNKHRQLHARSEALFQIAKVMFTLIPGEESAKQTLLTLIHDATNKHMESAGFDADIQKAVRASMDELAKVILA